MQNKSNRGSSGPVRHPSTDEWMSYVYGEVEQPAKAEMDDHLVRCAECQSQVNTWKKTLGALDLWTVPQPIPKVVPIANNWVRWAAAAILFMAIGITVGRFTIAAPDIKELRADLEQSIRDQVYAKMREEISSMIASSNQQLADDLKRSIAATASETLQAAESRNQELLTAYDERAQLANQTLLNRLENLYVIQARQASDHKALRRDVETIAVLTESEFRQAKQQLVQLASHSDPRSQPTTQPNQIPNIP